MKRFVVFLASMLMAAMLVLTPAPANAGVSGTFTRNEWGDADIGMKRERIQNICNCTGWVYHTIDSNTKEIAYWKANDVGQHAVIIRYSQQPDGDWTARRGWDQEWTDPWPDLN